MKRKVLLTFPSELTDLPITYDLVKKYDLRMNILKASIGYNTEGTLLIELEGTDDNVSQGIKYMSDMGIQIDMYHTRIQWNSYNCVHCGSCTAVCPTSALSMSRDNWMISFDEIRCLGCNLCVNSCPLRVIESAS
jgi:ferredoxin